MALVVCAWALAKTFAVWVNTDALLSGRPPRVTQRTSASWPLLLVAATMATVLVSGFVADVTGITPLAPPKLTGVHLVKGNVNTVRAHVSEPATLQGEVRRRGRKGLATTPAQVAHAECKPATSCPLRFDAQRLRRGRYRVQVTATDWTTTASTPWRTNYRRR